MSSLAHPYLTHEQYVEIERTAEYKSEYINGLIAAVPAAKSRRLHNVLSALHWADKIAEIRDALRCYLVSRRRMAIAFSLTVTAHLFYFGTFYCTGRALEGNVMAASAVVRRDAFDHADCKHADRAAHQLCWNWSA